MQPLPPITRNMMIACVVVFCLQQIQQLPMYELFALQPVLGRGFWPWQPVTYAFLHLDFSHLFFNMLGFWMFGQNLEQLWGPRRYIQFMIASGLAAAATHMLISLFVPMGSIAGASGVLYGLLLGCAIYSPGMRIGLFMVFPTDMRTAVWVFAGLELFMGITGIGGPTAHFAHLGGMIGGYLMVLWWRHRRPGPRKPKLRPVHRR